MEDYYQDGLNDGYGSGYLNSGHDSPQTDGEKYDYRQGVEDGEMRRQISEELEREGY